MLGFANFTKAVRKYVLLNVNVRNQMSLCMKRENCAWNPFPLVQNEKPHYLIV